MTRLITIDPGEWTGVSLFDGDRLIDADILGKGLGEISHGLRTLVTSWDVAPSDKTAAVIEIPQVYQQKQWKGDPNDLIQVAIIAGLCTSILYPYCGVHYVKPREWKGQRPKAADIALTYSLLDVDEQALFDNLKLPKYKAHNTLDAIGIGLWKTGRR